LLKLTEFYKVLTKIYKQEMLSFIKDGIIQNQTVPSHRKLLKILNTKKIF